MANNKKTKLKQIEEILLGGVNQNLSISGDVSFNSYELIDISSGSTDSSAVNVGQLNSELIKKADLSGATFTGPIESTSVYSPSISGDTLYSGSTDLSDVFAPFGSNTDNITRVGNGTNTFTGGTDNNPTVNVSGLSIDNIAVSGTSEFSTITSGGTDLGNVFLSTSSTVGDLYDVNLDISNPPSLSDDGKYMFYDFDSQSFVTNDIVNHGTVVINARSDNGSTIPKGSPLFMSGGEVDDVVLVGMSNSSSVSTMPVIGLAGEDILVSGSKHIVTFGKLSGLDTTSSSTISNGESWSVGDVLYVGTVDGTLTKNRPNNSSDEIQRIAKVLKVHSSGGSLFIFNTARTAGLPNIGENKIWLGGNEGEAVEVDINDYVTRVGDGLNTFTGGTGNNPTVNVSALTIDNITVSGESSFQSLTATTLYGDGSNLTNISGDYLPTTGGTLTGTLMMDSDSGTEKFSLRGNGTLTSPQFSINTYGSTGSILQSYHNTTRLYMPTTGSFLVQSHSAGMTSAVFDIDGGVGLRYNSVTKFETTNEGVDIFGSINTNSIVTANTVNDILVRDVDGTFKVRDVSTISDSTRVQYGLNTYTGGTDNLPTVNISGLTVDNVTVSGESTFESISATTIISGSTDLYDIFITEVDGNDVTRVQPGTNTFTGGTDNLPTVSLVDSPSVDNITVSGSGEFDLISGNTIYSAGTNLEDIFVTAEEIKYQENIQYALTEDVSVADVYFYSFRGNSGLRSGGPSGMATANSCSPIICPLSGTIIEAAITVRGLGVNAGSVTYPCNYSVDLYKVGFSSEGTSNTVNFPFDNTTTIGINALANSDSTLSVTGLSISVNEGDMLGLKFNGSASYGTTNQIAYSRMSFIKLKIEEN